MLDNLITGTLAALIAAAVGAGWIKKADALFWCGAVVVFVFGSALFVVMKNKPTAPASVASQTQQPLR